LCEAQHLRSKRSMTRHSWSMADHFCIIHF
jgi:hypothetical protein